MVTPNLQHAMRTQQGKNLKRGRKPRKNSKKSSKKHSKTTAAKHASKPKERLNIMKAANEQSPRKRKTKSRGAVGKSDADENPPKSKSAKKVPKVTAPEVSKAPPMKVSKPKAKAMKRPAAAGHSSGGSAGLGDGVKGHRQQQRVGEGKVWVYRVLPNQTFGCRSCRFIFNGCHHCQKENFRGFSAAAMREQQEAEKAQEEAEGSQAEVTAGEDIKGILKNGKKAKKAKVSE